MLPRRPFLLGASALAATGGAPRSSTAGGLEPLTIILDWLLNPNHAGLFAAQASGAFAAHGLDVRLVAPSDPDSPSRLVAAGQADVAVGYGSQINMITSAGLPLLRIATLIDRPLNTIMASHRFATLAELRGRTIGYSVAGVEEAVLGVMLGSAGLKPGDYTTVKVNYDMVAAMLSGRLDAATGAYRNAEVIQIEQLGRTPSVFLPEQHGVPPYDELILVAAHSRVGDPRLRRLVAALGHGTQAVRHDPEGMWRAFARAHPELDSPYVHRSWQVTVPLLAADPRHLDAARYLAFERFCVQQGIIRTRQPLDAFATELPA